MHSASGISEAECMKFQIESKKLEEKTSGGRKIFLMELPATSDL